MKFFLFLRKILFLPLCFSLLFTLPSCGERTDDLFSSVSELRSNIFLAESEQFRIKIYAVKKESPYLSDGIARERSWRTEIYLTAPSGEKDCDVSFSLNGQTYGGDMSYDNVKSEYFYFATLDISSLQSLPLTLTYDDTVVAMNAVSVLEEGVLSPREVLQKIKADNREAFQALTDKNGFNGEIYLRLVFEGAPYYYAGLVDKQGKIFSILADGKTGNTLATRIG